jgi:hypothetical protein
MFLFYFVICVLIFLFVALCGCISNCTAPFPELLCGCWVSTKTKNLSLLLLLLLLLLWRVQPLLGSHCTSHAGLQPWKNGTMFSGRPPRKIIIGYLILVHFCPVHFEFNLNSLHRSSETAFLKLCGEFPVWECNFGELISRELPVAEARGELRNPKEVGTSAVGSRYRTTFTKTHLTEKT